MRAEGVLEALTGGTDWRHEHLYLALLGGLGGEELGNPLSGQDGRSGLLGCDGKSLPWAGKWASNESAKQKRLSSDRRPRLWRTSDIQHQHVW